jgi:hypothetical protein
LHPGRQVPRGLPSADATHRTYAAARGTQLQRTIAQDVFIPYALVFDYFGNLYVANAVRVMRAM